MSSFPVLRPLLCAALLCAGGPALAASGAAPAASGAALAPAVPGGAVPSAASAPSVSPSGPGATAAGRGAALPDPPASLDVAIPDLRQRIGERLAALRAARAAARRAGAAAPVAAASEPSAATAVEHASLAMAGVAIPRASRAAAAATTAPPSARLAAAGSAAAVGFAGSAAAAMPSARPAARRPRTPSSQVHGERSWSYAGDTGPEAWASLSPDYAGCAAGRRQSPIDIRDGIAVELEPLRFDYQPGAFSVLDTGHTVQVDVAPGNTLVVGGRRYELKQFHFHRPSEERLEGRGYEMDVHLVHADPEGRLAVVAVLVEGGRSHPLVQQVWNNLPLEPQQPQAAPGPIDPTALLPEDRRYATYMGSLTTPPCTEGVLWVVLKQPATMSPEQIAIFARLYPMNARPLQAASGRLIKQSN